MLNIKNINKLIEFSKTLTILYVEDNQDSRESTLKILNHFFDNIIIAVDGLDGYQRYKENQDTIDIILTDLSMPNLSGIGMLREIREINKSVYCIVLSAHNEVDYFIETINLGVDGYMLKPIEIQQFFDVLAKIVYHLKLAYEKEENTLKLEKLNNELHYKLNEELNKNQEQEEHLIHQSRLATIGELVAMITHQWKQPLSVLSSLISNIELRHKMGILTDDYLNDTLIKHKNKIEYLNKTINDFSNFFKKSTKQDQLSIYQLIDSSVRLIEDSYNSCFAKIIINYQIDKNTTIKTMPSKFNQVMLNILKNALDEYKNKNIENGITIILITKYNNCINIIIEDNAGGIPEDILPNIWDAYFSTKDKNGTGIGLYMSKTIVEKHLKGTIKATNKNDGAVFTICLPIIK
jgi:signal transduction histidine kinase